MTLKKYDNHSERTNAGAPRKPKHQGKKPVVAEKHMRNALRNSFHHSALSREELDELGFDENE
jgi:hypothetical protein